MPRRSRWRIKCPIARLTGRLANADADGCSAREARVRCHFRAIHDVIKSKEICMITRHVAGLILVASSWAFAQSAAGRPEFEVASVKPSKPAIDGRLMIRLGG